MQRYNIYLIYANILRKKITFCVFFFIFFKKWAFLHTQYSKKRTNFAMSEQFHP